jgi:DNA-binding NarL/FixJ family response regulator
MKTLAPPPCRKFRLLVVDDQPLLRSGVSQFINQQENMMVCGEADSIDSTRVAVRDLNPDLLILALLLGGGDVIELIKAFKVECPSMGVLVFSQIEEILFATRALRAGAAGYVSKQESPDEVLAAIRTVLGGGIYVSREIAVHVLRERLEQSGQVAVESVQRVWNLSDRELHVFRLIGMGFSTRRIAGELTRSVKTIESHRENIKHKLGLENGTALADYASTWVKDHLPLV